MDIGFETIGNATLICHDHQPVLVTDPWITESAYFGSWTLSHAIPDEQMHAIRQSAFVWISHGHPDHLSAASLTLLHNKTILLPDHIGHRIFDYLQAQGYCVRVLKNKVWEKLSDRIRIMCLCDYNQDATLLVDINGSLIINMNDSSAVGWKSFIKSVVKNYPQSFYLRLYGYGDSDMMNFYDEDGHRLTRDPRILTAPLGRSIARDTAYFGAKYFVPFSSMHKYQRADSIWANQYSAALTDYCQGFVSSACEILPAFIRFHLVRNTLETINPQEIHPTPIAPKQFGDDWHETLTESDCFAVKQYFQSIDHLEEFLDFINIRIGKKDSLPDTLSKSF